VNGLGGKVQVGRNFKIPETHVIRGYISLHYDMPHACLQRTSLCALCGGNIKILDRINKIDRIHHNINIL